MELQSPATNNMKEIFLDAWITSPEVAYPFQNIFTCRYTTLHVTISTLKLYWAAGHIGVTNLRTLKLFSLSWNLKKVQDAESRYALQEQLTVHIHHIYTNYLHSELLCTIKFTLTGYTTVDLAY